METTRDLSDLIEAKGNTRIASLAKPEHSTPLGELIFSVAGDRPEPYSVSEWAGVLQRIDRSRLTLKQFLAQGGL